MNHEDHEFSGSCPTCGQKYCGRETERLRAALKQIEEFPYVGTKASQAISLIARAALAPINEQHSDEAKSS